MPMPMVPAPTTPTLGATGRSAGTVESFTSVSPVVVTSASRCGREALQHRATDLRVTGQPDQASVAGDLRRPSTGGQSPESLGIGADLGGGPHLDVGREVAGCVHWSCPPVGDLHCASALHRSVDMD